MPDFNLGGASVELVCIGHFYLSTANGSGAFPTFFNSQTARYDALRMSDHHHHQQQQQQRAAGDAYAQYASTDQALPPLGLGPSAATAFGGEGGAAADARFADASPRVAPAMGYAMGGGGGGPGGAPYGMEQPHEAQRGGGGGGMFSPHLAPPHAGYPGMVMGGRGMGGPAPGQEAPAWNEPGGMGPPGLSGAPATYPGSGGGGGGGGPPYYHPPSHPFGGGGGPHHRGYGGGMGGGGGGEERHGIAPQVAPSMPAPAVPTVLEKFPGFVRCVVDIAPEGEVCHSITPPVAPTMPASAVPAVLEKFLGFVCCVVDMAPEVVGWVIGRSGSHIKEMKHRSGCGMWVDQKDLKLYITGTDMPRIHIAAGMVADLISKVPYVPSFKGMYRAYQRIHIAAGMVADLISKAPVNVSAAGVEDEVVSQMMDCPPHLIGLLIGRGGSTIKRIKEESRANVVINQKMMKVIVSGIPQSVRLAVAMIEDVFTFGKAADEQHHHATTMAAGHHTFPLQGTAQDYMEYGSDILDYGLVGGPGNAGGGDDVFRPRSVSASAVSPFTYQSVQHGAGRMGGSPYGASYERDVPLGPREGRRFEPGHAQGHDVRPAPGAFEPQASPQSMQPPAPQQPSSLQHRVQAGRPTSGGGGGGGARHPNPLAAPWVPQVCTHRELLQMYECSATANAVANATGERTIEGHMLRMAGVGTGTRRGGGASPLALSDAAKPLLTAPPSVCMEDYLEAVGSGLGHYASVFKENEIDLEAMRLMGARDFVEIGIPKGPAAKIAYALREGRAPPGATLPLSTRQFLSAMGMSKYQSSFEEAKVDIAAMAAMREQDFAELGVVKGPRLKIMAELQRMFPEHRMGSVESASAAGSVQASPPHMGLAEPCSRGANGSDASTDSASAASDGPSRDNSFKRVSPHHGSTTPQVPAM
ncbi:hypothetical protein JKP88DRAFT_268124 [Tribonema minus]|uniref:SAM domain-containing protein n=1 Tax=Tribonema minus TaxID=303371 RepID=A0A836CJQ9_9STRA|nr:hypothetical protein JKP88DRAFT_268124 [Tribonema minus]